jgi:hypothetical protein
MSSICRELRFPGQSSGSVRHRKADDPPLGCVSCLGHDHYTTFIQFIQRYAPVLYSPICCFDSYPAHTSDVHTTICGYARCGRVGIVPLASELTHAHSSLCSRCTLLPPSPCASLGTPPPSSTSTPASSTSHRFSDTLRTATIRIKIVFLFLILVDTRIRARTKAILIRP